MDNLILIVCAIVALLVYIVDRLEWPAPYAKIAKNVIAVIGLVVIIAQSGLLT